jgi:hypothetical protein
VKIPVGRTIEGAYGFAFSNFLNILGIAWFPYLVFVLVSIAGVAGIAASFGGLAHRDINSVDPSQLAAIFGFCLLWGLAFIVASSMVTVGILRQALGLHKGPRFIYFSLGAPVWRLIGGIFLAALLVIAIGIACAAIVGVVTFAVRSALPAGPAALVSGIAAIAGLCVYFYSAVRLTYLLPAVIVAENRIGIGEAWRLAQGSFWRIFVIVIATTTPVFIVFEILLFAINGAALMPNMQNGPAAMPAMPQLAPGLMAADGLLFLALLIIVAGLADGARAAAYLAVTGQNEGPES